MKPDDSNQFKLNKKVFISFLLSAVALVLLFFFVQRDYFTKLMDVLQPIIIGVIFAYLLNPLVKVLEKLFNKLFKKMKKEKTRKNLSRGCSICISLIALLSVCVAIISLIVPQLLKSINDLIADLPGMVNQASELYDSFMVKYDLPNRINEFTTWYTETIGGSESTFDLSSILTSLFSGLESGIIKSIGTVGNGVMSFFSTTVNIIIGLVVTVYLLTCKERMFAHFKKALYAFFKRDKVNAVIVNSRECNRIVTNFIVSKIIASLIVGVLCFVLMMIFDIQREHALLISVIIGVTDIIPFEISQDDFLTLAYSLEYKSEHPLAKAVVDKTMMMASNALKIRFFIAPPPLFFCRPAHGRGGVAVLNGVVLTLNSLGQYGQL